MLSQEEVFEKLVDSWRSLSESNYPPREPIKLLEYDQSIVYIEKSWGPAVPYPAVDHHDGDKNHGYRRVKGNEEAIASIPEVEGFPEYRDFLIALNSSDSPVESVGCEKGFFPVSDHPDIKIQLGSYTDMVFSDFELNASPENLLYLASVFVKAMEGSGQWWSKTELGLQRLRLLYGVKEPWGLMVKIQGYGQSEEEARSTWGVSLDKLAESIKNIEEKNVKNL